MVLKSIIILIIAMPFAVFAHSGKTNAKGCHTNTSTGEYHCHQKVAKTVSKTVSKTQARTSAKPLDKNCSDFQTKNEAQNFYIANGGPNTDLHRLDADRDGSACDELK